jgi:hypothetical protein
MDPHRTHVSHHSYLVPAYRTDKKFQSESSKNHITLRRMSRLGLESTLTISITTSTKTALWATQSSSIRSSTINLTLLSLWDARRRQYVLAAARTAVGADDREIRVPAHSYTTSLFGEERREMIIFMYLPLAAQSDRQTFRIRSSTAIWRRPDHPGTCVFRESRN